MEKAHSECAQSNKKSKNGPPSSGLPRFLAQASTRFHGRPARTAISRKPWPLATYFDGVKTIGTAPLSRLGMLSIQGNAADEP